MLGSNNEINNIKRSVLLQLRVFYRKAMGLQKLKGK